MLDVGHESGRMIGIDVVLLGGVVFAESEQHCCGPVIGDGGDSLDRGQDVVGNSLGTDVPRSRLAA